MSERYDSGGDSRQPVVGVYEVKDPDFREDADNPHHLGWNQAMDKALRDLHWPPGDHSAHVDFALDIRVVNPGVVLRYKITLIPGG